MSQGRAAASPHHARHFSILKWTLEDFSMLTKCQRRPNLHLSRLLPQSSSILKSPKLIIKVKISHLRIFSTLTFKTNRPRWYLVNPNRVLRQLCLAASTTRTPTSHLKDLIRMTKVSQSLNCSTSRTKRDSYTFWSKTCKFKESTTKSSKQISNQNY